jgi:DNA-binding winged helix-turn-helix (wHTH) protein
MMIAYPRVVSVEEVAATFDGNGATVRGRARQSIARLRRALMDAGAENPIALVPRVGYRLDPGRGPRTLTIEEHGNA